MMFSGCWFDAIRTEDVAGIYNAALPEGAKARYGLRSDGKCERVIRMKDGLCYTNNGVWRYTAWDRSLIIKGSGFRPEVNLEGRINPELSSLAPYDLAIGTRVRRGAFGGIRFPTGEDVVYRKE